jgi:hypothetical protein
LEPGHGPKVYFDPIFRRLLVNAVIWGASEDPPV